MSQDDQQLDSLLNLEDHYYKAGYDEGHADGIRGGKIDGRSVGLKAGFEKFVESGRLAGRAVVWANRQQRTRQPSAVTAKIYKTIPTAATTPSLSSSSSSSSPSDDKTCSLPPLPTGNTRLRKNISTLWALIEPETLSTRNTDEAVDDFSDRVRRANGKAKVIRRIVGEEEEGDGKK